MLLCEIHVGAFVFLTKDSSLFLKQTWYNSGNNFAVTFQYTWSLYHVTLYHSASAHQRIYYCGMGNASAFYTTNPLITRPGALSTIQLRSDYRKRDISTYRQLQISRSLYFTLQYF